MAESFKRPFEEKKVRFRTNLLGTKKNTSWWFIIIIFSTFIISAVLSLLSSSILEDSNYIISFIHNICSVT